MESRLVSLSTDPSFDARLVHELKLETVSEWGRYPRDKIGICDEAGYLYRIVGTMNWGAFERVVACLRRHGLHEAPELQPFRTYEVDALFARI